MVNRLNEFVVKELTESLGNLSHCIVVDYNGLTAEESVDLRTILRQRDVRMRVVKNRLARIALKSVGLPEIGDFLAGQCALVTGGEDMPTAAKLVFEWIKKNKKMAVRGGYAEGAALDEASVRRMAAIPPRPVLLAMIASAIQSGPQRVAYALQSVQASLARAFDEIRKQKETAAPPPAEGAEASAADVSF